MNSIKLKIGLIVILGLLISGCTKSPEPINNLKGTEAKFVIDSRQWTVRIFTNTESPKGVFWFLPHDDENTAEKSAQYAVKKYGGGYLKICANNQREFEGIDPNRYFKKEPQFANTILQLINRYRATGVPYLTLHNNKREGNITILNKTSNKKRKLIKYPAHNPITRGKGKLSDDNNLVYIAGKNIKQSDINALLNKGLNVIYERVTKSNNDGSMSNYIALNSNVKYYNIEAEHKKLKIQKKMIDLLMSVIGKKPLR